MRQKFNTTHTKKQALHSTSIAHFQIRKSLSSIAFLQEFLSRFEERRSLAKSTASAWLPVSEFF